MITKSYARQLLQHWGVGVNEIPISNKEEADFLVSFGECKVLIEEKTKFDDPGRLAERAKLLSWGEIYPSSTPLTRDNRLSGIIAKGASQLQSSSERDHNFRLLWFTGTGVDAEAKYYQFIATIYGTTNIIEMNASHYRRCYFFRNSDFYRHADIIDGAVVAYVFGSSSITAKLCLNPLSAKCSALRDSPVVVQFGSAIEDPEVLEGRKKAFIVDGDIDRNDEGAVLTFLQSKYGTAPLMKLNLNYVSATILENIDE
jgi:hypothetical protein